MNFKNAKSPNIHKIGNDEYIEDVRVTKKTKLSIGDLVLSGFYLTTGDIYEVVCRDNCLECREYNGNQYRLKLIANNSSNFATPCRENPDNSKIYCYHKDYISSLLVPHINNDIIQF